MEYLNWTILTSVWRCPLWWPWYWRAEQGCLWCRSPEQGPAIRFYFKTKRSYSRVCYKLVSVVKFWQLYRHKYVVISEWIALTDGGWNLVFINNFKYSSNHADDKRRLNDLNTIGSVTKWAYLIMKMSQIRPESVHMFTQNRHLKCSKLITWSFVLQPLQKVVLKRFLEITKGCSIWLSEMRKCYVWKRSIEVSLSMKVDR